jgi:hypothetical protein
VTSVTRKLLLAVLAASALLGLQAAPAMAGTAGPITAADPNANLVAATITFNTIDDDKDADTLVTSEVDDVNGNIAALAQDFYTRFPDHTTNGPFDLEVGAATAAELNGGQFILTIAPTGHDTWIFGFRLKLFFDDGKMALCGKGKVVLTQDSPTVSCTLKTV